MKDFFISYNRFDLHWAEWIAWTLEEAGYSVIIQAWDFRPGGNFVLDMQRAAAETQKTIAVLSPTYLKSAYTQPEWAAAFVEDPTALNRKFIPVRVAVCEPEGLLRAIAYVDLVGATQEEAKHKLLTMMCARLKPDIKPNFPGSKQDTKASSKASPENNPHKTLPFPNEEVHTSAISRVEQIKFRNRNRQIQALEEDYNAAFDQLQYTLSEVDRNRLERQIQQIEHQMTRIAEKLHNPLK